MRSFYVLAVAAAAIGMVPGIATPSVGDGRSGAETEKMLRIEITVPASRAEVLKVFSTSEGLSTWLAPNSVVELKPGGEWMVHFHDSSAGGTIVSFVPEKEIVIAALAPEQFPTVRAQRTIAKFELEDHGKATLVRLTQTGWKDGDEWDRAYEYLTAGNAELMATLHRRFVNGPIDWSKH
ncbi:MAG: SRPBCC domain-containing protein [Gemmatimonadaceae bacterium]|nr:SRPBCC domain-containing protein [Gemmatimonadaceae bacterium]